MQQNNCRITPPKVHPYPLINIVGSIDQHTNKKRQLEQKMLYQT